MIRYLDNNAGNILTASDGTASHTYTYGDAVWQDKLTAYDGHAFAYDASGNPYALDYNGTVYYYILNLQGDVLALVDGSGNEVAAYTYTPYGEVITATGAVAEVNPLRYRGYYYDTDTGFYYLQSRYYDPTLCRFLNADGYMSTGQGILGCNMFAYCGSNPVIRADDSGECYTYRGEFYDCGSEKCSFSENYNPEATGLRDVTEEVDRALLKEIARIRRRSRKIPLLSPLIYVGKLVSNYIDFYYMVRDGARWDIKEPDSWNQTIEADYPEGTVIYHGMELSVEALGNVTYGILGHAYGIPLEVLLLASFYNAGFPTDPAECANEAMDWGYIEIGYYAYG